MKRFTLTLAACVLLALPAAAQTQQVTKVGICDFIKVLNSAYKDTKSYRDWDQARTDYNKEVSARSKEITELQNQKLDADKAGNKTQSLTLEATISAKQKDLDYFQRVKGTVLQQQGDALFTGPMLQEIMDVVKYFMETGGYALILRSDIYKGLILLNIPEVDITDDAIAELLKRQGKVPGGQ